MKVPDEGPVLELDHGTRKNRLKVRFKKGTQEIRVAAYFYDCCTGFNLTDEQARQVIAHLQLLLHRKQPARESGDPFTPDGGNKGDRHAQGQ